MGGWRGFVAGVMLAVVGCGTPQARDESVPSEARPPGSPAEPEAAEARRAVPPLDFTGTSDASGHAATCAPAWPGQTCSASCFCVETPGVLPQPVTSVWAGGGQAWVVAGGQLFRWSGQGFSGVSDGRRGYGAVWGSGTRDVWAVGEDGALAHWDGERLTETVLSSGASLVSIWGSSASDVWVVGMRSQVFRWDGTRWSEVPLPGLGRRPFDELYRVTGGGPDDVWVEGSDGALAHWDGSAWSDRSIPGMRTGEPPYNKLRSLHVRADGTALASGHIRGWRTWQWDGARWLVLEGPWGQGVDVLMGGSDGEPWAFWKGGRARLLPLTGSWHSEDSAEPYTVRAVDASGRGDVWTVGDRGLVQRWDGSGWQTLAQPGEAPRGVTDISFSAHDSGWAVDGSSVVKRWDGARWHPLVLGTARDVFTRVWSQGPSEAWFSGRTRLILSSTALVVRWDGRQAHRLELPEGFHGHVSQVWGVTPDDVWLLERDSGGIYHWDGHALTRSELPVGHRGAQPLAVWGSRRDDVWLGATRGGFSQSTLFHWDGQRWSVAGLPFATAKFTESVYSLWGTSERDVWALGDSGLMHYDGEAWRMVLDAPLWGDGRVTGTGPDDVWVTGLRGAAGAGVNVAHFDGRVWRPILTGDPRGDAVGGVPGAFWAGGAGGLLRYRPAVDVP